MILTSFEERCIKKGISQGIEQGKMEDAKKMVEKNMTNADIRDITGLSIKTIQELRTQASKK